MHVITGLRVGGAENQLYLLAHCSGTKPMVVTLTNAFEVADALRADGVTVVDLGMRSNRDVTTIIRLARLMARERPDVVHLHLYRATVYGRVAARLARVPVVLTTEHSLLEGELEGHKTTAAVRGLYMATEPLNTGTIAVSQDVARRLQRWGVQARKIHVVPNGIDLSAVRIGDSHGERTRREFGLPSDSEIIGGMGRLHRGKRWDMLLRALAPDLGPTCRILLVGAGDEEENLVGLAASLGISPWVCMPGGRTDPAAMLAAMDVVVSPSPQETFGLSLVEAAAAGRRVVYVSSPGLDALGPLPGVVRVPATEAALRGAVHSALSQRTAAPSVDRFSQYDIRAVASHVDAIYRACLTSSGWTNERVPR